MEIVVVALLVFVGIPIGIFAAGRWSASRKPETAMLQGTQRPPRIAIEAEMAAMRERLHTLERIVTDRGYDVATQIEALRDRPRERDADGPSNEFRREEA